MAGRFTDHCKLGALVRRLVLRPELASTYIRWLIPWALVSQPVFWFAGREWYAPNVMATLLLGTFAIWIINALQRPQQSFIAIIAVALLGWTADYGSVGVLSIPLIFLVGRHDHRLGIGALAVLGMAVNLPIESTQDAYAVLASFAAPIIAIASLSLQTAKLPRLPKFVFYAFYPAHLLLFTLIAQSLS
jgi:hypothetical protein